MSDLLHELVGREVSVWTDPGLGQPGTLQDVGSRWMRLASDAHGTLLIPTRNIRLIKVNGTSMTAQAALGELPPSLLGRTVSVSSRSGEYSYGDTGQLEAFDDDWLRVQVKGSQLYFAISNITLLRPI